jgi:two-component system sensor histidine kinase/response regulator
VPALSSLFIQATQSIRESEQASGKHIPIIAMTANALKSDGLRCFAAGMGAYVAKPVNTETLLRAIDTLVSQAV